MEEITITIPKKLEKGLSRLSKEELQRAILDFLKFRALEIEFDRSKEVQHAMLELLSSKSKLTSNDAKKLASKIDFAMAKELKSIEVA